jgi:pyruvate/2-oxoacid:ferredoxin oxidoreductase beta subunit
MRCLRLLLIHLLFLFIVLRGNLPANSRIGAMVGAISGVIVMDCWVLLKERVAVKVWVIGGDGDCVI